MNWRAAGRAPRTLISCNARIAIFFVRKPFSCVTTFAVMFSLQKLLGKEDKFFDLLEASAEEARASVQALIKLTKTPDQTTLLYEFVQSRRKEKQISAEIREAVYNTFVTALEREDIENLSNALYR